MNYNWYNSAIQANNSHKLRLLHKEAAFGNYQYVLPKDPEKALFDFYSLANIGAPFLGEKSLKGNESLREDILELKSSIMESLTSQLKENIKKAVFMSVCAEFRHITDNETTKNIINLFDKMGASSFIRKYIQNYTVLQSNKNEFFRDSPSIKKEDLKGMLDKRGYADSYRAIQKTGIEEEKFISMAKASFLELKWVGSYGGDKWANICKGWLNLNRANKVSSIVIAIDHIYDLEHNTGTVFNKVNSFSKKGSYDWIKKALDFKANLSGLEDIYSLIESNKISSSLKKPLMAILNNTYGSSYEWYLREKDKDKAKGSSVDSSVDTEDFYNEKTALNTKDPLILAKILEKGLADAVSIYAAQNKNCYPETLAKILEKGKSDWVSYYAIKNPNCPSEALAKILEKGKGDWLNKHVIDSPNCPPEAKEKWKEKWFGSYKYKKPEEIKKTEESFYNEYTATHTKDPVTLTTILEKGKDDKVSCSAAFNSNCPPETLAKILGKGVDDAVSGYAAQNKNCPASALAKVLEKGLNDVVSCYAASNPNCSPETLAKILLKGKDDWVSWYASQNKNCPDGIKKMWEKHFNFGSINDNKLNNKLNNDGYKKTMMDEFMKKNKEFYKYDYDKYDYSYDIYPNQ